MTTIIRLPGKMNARTTIILILAVLGMVARSNAATTFTKITAGAVAISSGATGGAWGDFNNDGWMDLFVSLSGGTTSVIYTNNGSGNFAADTSAGIGSGTGSSWGSAWG